jgi:hypothetical protein
MLHCADQFMSPVLCDSDETQVGSEFDILSRMLSSGMWQKTEFFSHHRENLKSYRFLSSVAISMFNNDS